jgi:hypothetical protein
VSSLHDVTPLAIVLHVGAGTLSLFAGFTAVFAQKGGPLHRAAGNVFFVSMLVMAAFAAYLGVVIPDQFTNVVIAAFVSYLVGTSWLTVQRAEGSAGFGEKIGLAAALCLCAPFAILSYQVTTGAPPLFKSAVPFEGRVLIAIYVFTGVTAMAALADAKVIMTGGISGAPRIARHLWRMCLGLTMATGSAFSNGLPRLLPGPTPQAFFYVQLLPLALLFFWLIRVRLTNWFARSAT